MQSGEQKTKKNYLAKPRRHLVVQRPTALQFEWKWKQLTRKQPVRMDPLEKRRQALAALLELNKATQNALPFSEWPCKPIVSWTA